MIDARPQPTVLTAWLVISHHLVSYAERPAVHPQPSGATPGSAAQRL